MTNNESTPTEPSVDQAFACDECDHRWYYTRSRCPVCRSGDISTYELGTGEVVQTTTAEVTPGDVRSPNWLALVRFDDVQVILQLDDGDITAGDTVEFAGEYRLRKGDTVSQPRLTAVRDAY